MKQSTSTTILLSGSYKQTTSRQTSYIFFKKQSIGRARGAKAHMFNLGLAGRQGKARSQQRAGWSLW